MPSEEQVVSPDAPPFKIRDFVSTIRAQDFSRCWPFSQRILERCLLLGMKVELPPLDSPSDGYIFGSCNNDTQISFSKCSSRAVSCGFCTESCQQFDSKESREISRGSTDLKHVVLCGTDAKKLAEKTISSGTSSLVFSQNVDHEAVLRPSTESLWEDNAIMVSTGNASSSGSQVVGQGKTDPQEHVGKSLSGKLGVLHVVKDALTVKKEPNHSLFQVAVEEGCSDGTTVKKEPNHCRLQVTVEEGCSASVNHLTELRDTCMGSPSRAVLGKFHASVNDGQNPGDSSNSPTAIHRLATQLTEFEPSVHVRKTEKRKHATDFGLRRSNSDASVLQVCPVCSKFSSGSNTALNAHIDHCLVLDEADTRPSKKRFKIRKLRSMVDIYATAPTRTLEDLERSSLIWSLHKV